MSREFSLYFEAIGFIEIEMLDFCGDTTRCIAWYFEPKSNAYDNTSPWKYPYISMFDSGAQRAASSVRPWSLNLVLQSISTVD